MGKKHDKPLHLAMPFEEALNRFGQTTPDQVDAPKKTRAKKKIAHASLTESLSAEDSKTS